MNFLYRILLSYFVFLRIPKVDSGSESISAESHHSYAGPSDLIKAPVMHQHLPNVKINLVVSPDYQKHLNLKLVNRVLANEHLPVWVMKKKDTASSEGRDECELDLVPTVMEQLGGFSFYQDIETTSAAVYYHQRREFDGMIDTKYLIQGLSIDKIHKSAKTKIRLGESGIISRGDSMDHPPQDRPDTGGPVHNSDHHVIRTYKDHLYSGYPEILVFVACDVAQALLVEGNHPDKYSSIVSYVLTLFNGVDMLYSKLKSTNIQLNIAGIVIETECGAFSFLKNCYTHSHNDRYGTPNLLLDAVCISEKLGIFLFDWWGTAPVHSFDVTTFLTRTRLYREENGTRYGVDGVTYRRKTNHENQMNELLQLSCIIQDKEHFRSYGVIAHELAHSMGVPHDMSVLVKEGECCRNIMKIGGTYWCEKCLSWSHQSEQSLNEFFSSTDCCIFINSPRSLHSPDPRLILTADEQCRCYGYRSAVPMPRLEDPYCESDLICEDDNSETHVTLTPRDGTPCSPNQVCWDFECIAITRNMGVNRFHSNSHLFELFFDKKSEDT